MGLVESTIAGVFRGVRSSTSAVIPESVVPWMMKSGGLKGAGGQFVLTYSLYSMWQCLQMYLDAPL